MKLIGSITKRLLPIVLIAALSFSGAVAVDAAPLTNVSLLMAQPEPGATNVDYAFLVSNQSNTNLRCISIQFNTISDGSGLVPAGFNAGSATFSGSLLSDWTGWTTSDTGGVAKITRAASEGPNLSAGAELMLSGITNGTTANSSVFALIHTYSNQACTTSVDSAVINFSWNNDTIASATVDPTLTFAVDPLNSGSCNGAAITGVGSTSTAVSLGKVDKTTRAVGGQELTVGTNAGGGFSVYAHVDGPLTDGRGHNIASIGSSSDSPAPFPNPGTEAFGYTVDSPLSTGDPSRFVSGGTKWAGIDTSDREVVYSPFSAVPISGWIAYQITISGTTVGGQYGDNVTYTAVPSF